jgi:excinuclease ABC subunit A
LIHSKSVSAKVTAKRSFAPAEDEPREFHYSERFACRYDGTEYAQPEPRLFSFNNPYGACPVCQGFGNVVGLDIDLVIPDPSRTLDAGAIDPWTKPQYEWAKDELQRFLPHRRHPDECAFRRAHEAAAARHH